MSDTRLAGRLRVLPRVAANRFLPRRKPAHPRRILVAHHLLAGDVFMLAPLLAKLRERYPQADVAMTVRPALIQFFARKPYGVRAIAYDPRDSSTLDALFAEPAFDLAIVPGDNRYSWLAAASRAGWIVAFGGDRPAYKSWPVDEERPYRASRAAWADMAADLIDGPPPRPYRKGDWPPPPAAPFESPSRPYALLHVEASTPLRHWEDAKWRVVARALVAKGLAPVLSAGPRGEAYLRQIDPQGEFPALGHSLDLPQLWHLIVGARLLVCPDTSVAHIGKLTFTPTVTLFGPTSAELFGKGEFWRDAPFAAVTFPDFPCRDQQTLFKRKIEWIRRCQRSTDECAEPRCMQAIEVQDVMRAVASLGL